MRSMKLAVLSLAVALVAFAQGATVVTREGTGEAAIVANDKPRAYAEAKEKALRAAVEQAAGVRIDSDTVTVNNQLVRDVVFSNTGGYVKKFDVVSQKDEKGVATVVVKADVITDNLDRDIAAARGLVKRMGRPSLVIMMNEQTLQITEKGQAAVTSTDTTATVLTDAFKKDGWDIKDPAFAMGKVRVAPGVTLGAAEAKEIGNLSKAAYILYGSATLRNQEPTPMMQPAGGPQTVFPVTGEYELSLFATDSGSQIAKVAGKLVMGSAGEPEMAIMKKMLVSYERSAFDMIQRKKDEVVGPVRGAVLEYFRNRNVNGAELVVSVTGLESFGSAKDFKKSMDTIKGIKETEQKEFAAGKATYRVTFLGTPSELAEAVESSTFKKRKLAVTAVTGNTLEIAVGK